MNRVSIMLLGAILIVGGSCIYLYRNDLGISFLSSSGSTSDQSAHPASISWTVVDRSAEGFKIEMPATTREIEVPAYNKSGSAEQVDMLYVYPDPSTSFSVSWAEDPPVMRAEAQNPDQTLEEARNGALTRTQAVLVSESQSTRQGFPVRDFVGRNQGGGVFNARLVLADHRLYMLMVSYPAAGARRDDDVNRFFDSFHVVRTTLNAPGN